jgi:uncharacterized membrane protein
MVLLLWGGAFGVDLGITVVGGRQMQAMADTAALDMARYIDVADWSPTINGVPNGAGPSAQYLNGKLAYADTDNGSNATLSETPGVWLNGSFTPQGQKVGTPAQTVQCWYYKPFAAHPCNAVKVTATQTVPQIFAGGHPTVTRSSIASVEPESGFDIGSYLASVNSQQSAVLNALLGTLGGTASVSLVGYQGLANTSVTINQLITASGGLLTSSNVLTTSLLGSQWQAIWSDAVANQVAQVNCSSTPTPLPCSASTALSALDVTASTSVSLCQLVSINGSTCSTGSNVLSTAALSTSLNVLQMLTTEAEVANGTHAIDLGTSLGITGVSDAKLTLTLGQIPQVAFGPVGTTASTVQLTTDLQLNDGLPGIIDIPLSAAQGTATLTTLTCAFNSMTATSIQPTTTPVTGNISLAGVVLASISVSGVNSGNTSPLGYGPSVVPPTATTAAGPPTNPVGPTNPLPVGTTTPTLATGTLVVGTLSGSILNGVVGPILQAVGVSVGNAEVADLSTNCGSVSLVQ